MTDSLGVEADRLWELVAARAVPGADTAKIDRRIWNLFGEEWAIMFTDLSGFSRQVATFGITHFLQIIYEHVGILNPIIDVHDGILLKTEADSMMVLFRDSAHAVQCAIAMQQRLSVVNVDRSDETKILLCVGIGAGKVLKVGRHDVYGEAVNAASKLGEDIAKSGEVLVTSVVREQLRSTGFTFELIEDVVAGSTQNFRLNYPAT
jgi:adenylate cyclase